MYLVLILSMGHSKVLNNSKDDTQAYVFEANSNGHLFKLQAPIVYTTEDLVMSLAVLLILLIMILLWYSLARAIIYLAYHSEESSRAYQKNIEENSIYEESLLKHGVKL